MTCALRGPEPLLVRFSAVPLSTAHNVLLIKADSISFASSSSSFFHAISVYCCASQQQRPTHSEIPPVEKGAVVINTEFTHQLTLPDFYKKR